MLQNVRQQRSQRKGQQAGHGHNHGRLTVHLQNNPGAGLGVRSQAQHGTQIVPGLCQVVVTKYNPTDQDKEQQVEMSNYSGETGKKNSHPPTFKHEKNPMHQAPDDEVPAGAVPETAEQKYGTEVTIRPQIAPPVPAQRNVKILTKPLRESKMPNGI